MPSLWRCEKEANAREQSVVYGGCCAGGEEYMCFTTFKKFILLLSNDVVYNFAENNQLCGVQNSAGLCLWNIWLVLAIRSCKTGCLTILKFLNILKKS